VANVDEWVGKAEEDWSVAVSLTRRRKLPVPSIVCFHCQQCVEKYLKACLVYHRDKPPRIHDLHKLLVLCERRDPLLGALASQMKALDPHAVLTRYPGATATVNEAKDAVAAARVARQVLRKRLGL